MKFPWLMCLFASVALTVAGCKSWSSPWKAPPIKEKITEETKDGVKTITRTIIEQDYFVLNAVGTILVLAAGGLVLSMAIFHFPVPPRSIALLIGSAVAFWLLRYFLIKYEWLIATVGLVGLLTAGAGFAYGHRGWLERRLNLDIDHDGKIGE